MGWDTTPKLRAKVFHDTNGKMKKDKEGVWIISDREAEVLNKTEKMEKMKKLHEEELDLYIRKSFDYGSKPIEETGTVGLLVRILDKVHRALHLSEDGRIAMVTDENLRDTLMDISNYANMTIIEEDRHRNVSNPISEGV